ncbi:hypothetical protein GN958_ATG00991, partial [Phytophthora infestans]
SDQYLAKPSDRLITIPTSDHYNVLVKKNTKRARRMALYCSGCRHIRFMNFLIELKILFSPGVHVSSFGVVNKRRRKRQSTGRVNDLSYQHPRPSMTTLIKKLCVTHITSTETTLSPGSSAYNRQLDREVSVEAGDVSSTYRHVGMHSYCAYLLGGRPTRDSALIMEMDDHINFASNDASNYQDAEQLLCHAIHLVRGLKAINAKPITRRNTRQKALGSCSNFRLVWYSCPNPKPLKP